MPTTSQMPGSQASGASPRVLMKMEQICRFRVAGVPDVRIAALLGMSNSGLQRILALPEYQQIEQSVLQGHLTNMDDALAGKVDEMRKAFQVGVPAAMRCLLETVTQRRDLRAAMAAASEILDRDPDRAFTKTNKMVVAGVGTEATLLPENIILAAATEGAKIAASVAAKASSTLKQEMN